MADYNFFRDHETLGGRTPAEVVGVADKVPWKSWEDVARMGGEIAEPQNVTVEPIKRKPGPKPKNSGDSLKSAAEEFILAEQKQKASDAAKKAYKNRDKSPVAIYPPPHRKIPRKRVGGG